MVCLILATVSYQPSKAASPIYVRTDGDDDNCNGTVDVPYPGSGGPDLDCAVHTIQKGVDLVEDGGIVHVDAGEYDYEDWPILIEKNLTLEGEFSLWDWVNNGGTNGTIIDYEFEGPEIVVDGAYTVNIKGFLVQDSEFGIIYTD